MMLTSEFVGYLQAQFADTKFYNGAINKNEAQNIGVFARDGAAPRLALGGKDNTSYNVLPITILVHWSEDSNVCEIKAWALYNYLFASSNFYIGARRIVQIQMLNPNPIDIGRDENNFCERVIRLNIFYEEVE